MPKSISAAYIFIYNIRHGRAPSKQFYNHSDHQRVCVRERDNNLSRPDASRSSIYPIAGRRKKKRPPFSCWNIVLMRRHIVQIKSSQFPLRAPLLHSIICEADAPSSAIIVISLSISLATSQSVKHLMPPAACRRASLQTSSSRCYGQIDRCQSFSLVRYALMRFCATQ